MSRDVGSLLCKCQGGGGRLGQPLSAEDKVGGGTRDLLLLSLSPDGLWHLLGLAAWMPQPCQQLRIAQFSERSTPNPCPCPGGLQPGRPHKVSPWHAAGRGPRAVLALRAHCPLSSSSPSPCPWLSGLYLLLGNPGHGFQMMLLFLPEREEGSLIPSGSRCALGLLLLEKGQSGAPFGAKWKYFQL